MMQVYDSWREASRFDYTKVGVPIVTTVVGKRTFCYVLLIRVILQGLFLPMMLASLCLRLVPLCDVRSKKNECISWTAECSSCETERDRVELVTLLLDDTGTCWCTLE